MQFLMVFLFLLICLRFVSQKMDPATTLVLTIQLLALFAIAGALLLYLLCKVRGTNNDSSGGQKGGTVLVTSADTALGLQLCTHLALRGCRVFAGMRDPVDSLPAKLLRGWMKIKENVDTPMTGSIVPLRVDVTREDVLKEATESMGAHLNAGERGILAVINTAGIVFRGRIEQQDSQQWEAMFKTNVLGSLRTARAFAGLLRPTRGRLIFFGAGNEGEGLVAFSASRVAVDGCADALRKELQPYGIGVISLNTTGVPAESLFRSPIPFSQNISKYKCYIWIIVIIMFPSFKVSKKKTAAVLRHSIPQRFWPQVPSALSRKLSGIRSPTRVTNFVFRIRNFALGVLVVWWQSAVVFWKSSCDIEGHFCSKLIVNVRVFLRFL